jgi:nitric oxide reductase FlRd-NAD(+) reductase
MRQRVMIVGGRPDWHRTGDGFLSRRQSRHPRRLHAASILSALMPAEVSSRLQHRLTDMGVHLLLKAQLHSLTKTGERHSWQRLDGNRSVEVDVVVAATGLRPETALAQRAGADTQVVACR